MTNQKEDKRGSFVVFINVSEYDLNDDDIQACVGLLGLEEVLHQIGFDKEYSSFENTNGFYEVLDCTHKTRTGKVVQGKLYIGKEREDKSWLESGMASSDVKMSVRRDRSYLQEIRNLSKSIR